MELRNFIKRFKESKAEEKPFSEKYPQRVEDVFNAVKMLTDEDMNAALTFSKEQLEDATAELFATFCEVDFPIYSAYEKIGGLYMRERVIMHKIKELLRAVLEYLAFVDEHFTPKSK